MSKQEKYYHYIMNDLLSNTIMEWDVDEVKTPFTVHRVDYRIFKGWGDVTNDGSNVAIYLQTHYGANKEDIKYIWDWYLWNIESTITGDYGE